MASQPVDLPHLLDALDVDADLVHRHLWMIALFDWIRGSQNAAEASVARVEILLDVLDARPATQEKLQVWWRKLVGSVDCSTLLSDYGFATRNAFMSELVQRLNSKWLPTSPQTTDGSELFDLVMPSPQDAQWLAALSSETILARHLVPVSLQPADLRQRASS